jgi:formylmethanofuran dehydrogenase subunit E
MQYLNKSFKVGPAKIQRAEKCQDCGMLILTVTRTLNGKPYCASCFSKPRKK